MSTFKSKILTTEQIARIKKINVSVKLIGVDTNWLSATFQVVYHDADTGEQLANIGSYALQSGESLEFLSGIPIQINPG